MSAERGGRWEDAALRVLAFPANLALAGVAAFLLALPVVTTLSAAIAAGGSLHRWRSEDDDRVFTGTFRCWRATWRRTLPMSMLAAGGTALLIVNWLFLGHQSGALAGFLIGATVPVAAVWTLVLVHVPAVAARAPELGARQWLVRAIGVVFARPLRSGVVLVVVVTWAALCVVLPTLFPVLGISVPVMAGLLALDDAVARAGG